METLKQLFRYNAWANERVLALCRELDPARLGESAGGTISTAGETLKHLAMVEDAYLTMLTGGDVQTLSNSREALIENDLGWFARRLATISEGYAALLAQRDPAFLNDALHVPWFSFPMTARDGLIQVVTHSTQHRAQVFSFLGGLGVTVPELDYVAMLGEAHGDAAE